MAARTIHPFPARMAPDIALRWVVRRKDSRPLRILDPMCGSGTVLSMASEHGHTAVGYDLDPLAVLMSHVAVAPVDRARLEGAATDVTSVARRSRAGALPWRDEETRSFARYWFGERQRLQLTRLARSVNAVEDFTTRSVLQVALSRVIVTKSPKASLAADTSHSRPHRVIDSSEYDVVGGFEQSVRQLGNLLDKRTLVGDAVVKHGDARCLDVADGTIDLVVTSPPYLTAIDYLRGHRLALIWFGYSVSELRGIRSSSVGAERGLETSDPATARMVRMIESSCAAPKLLPRSTIARYADDLVRLSAELYRVCRPR
ncbi:MAG TPA: hypothetical protein VF711_10340, partial [Acidimicrobiales bacterium]